MVQHDVSLPGVPIGVFQLHSIPGDPHRGADPCLEGCAVGSRPYWEFPVGNSATGGGEHSTRNDQTL